MQDVRLILVGLGNLGWRFCELLPRKASLLEACYGLRFTIVAAADSRGAASEPNGGLDPLRIAAIKRRGGTIADYPGAGRYGWTAAEMVATLNADVLCEASPVNLGAGAEPAITCIRLALSRGMHVVTPNKGPLVLAYSELHELAEASGAELRFDGTVAGGLPALNIGTRDLRGAVIERVEAIPNLTTGLVLDLLAGGASWPEAVEIARDAGTLEGDGTWDLEGWDAAAKLVILANAVLRHPARLEDVAVRGILDLDPARLLAESGQGRRCRLLATAERSSDGTYNLTVAPAYLMPSHPLAHLGSHAMGVAYFTDIYGVVSAIIDEQDPIPSAATMLRDLLDIYAKT